MAPDSIATDRDTREKAVRKLRTGLMPPAGKSRPDRATLDRTPLIWAQGVFLATHPPQAKPTTIALLKQLQGAS